MPVQTRAIKRRIKSVKNTRKITKAMELVAASKMRKAMQSVLGTRPYAQLAWNTVLSISKTVDVRLHPLLKEHPETKRVLLLLLTSDRGLAGGFNANILRRTFDEMKRLGSNVEIQTVCVGKRGADAMKRLNKPILASFTDITNNTTFENVLPIGRLIIEEYIGGAYDKVVVAYTNFVSAMTQTPVMLELLPLAHPAAEEINPDMMEYVFEPTAQEVLDQILPRLIETMVYQSVLESSASEHSARMMAMRSASDAAGDMIEDLTFTFNQARQAGITQEIAEISSGKAALES